MRLKVFLLTLSVVLFIIPVLAAGTPEDLLSLENKYIKVFINNSSEDTGRFAVDVTGGDPARQDDDNKPLIYGHPKPWTSFTTIKIDGTNYVFGKATNKRSGAGLPGGEIVQPPQLVNDQLIMKCKYGPVEVEQDLDIIRSPSTGALDTARIKYVIRNSGSASAQIGLRSLLDTMVGNNDGAPFRLGNKAITTDYSIEGNECPDFWQAFDSLAKPAVIAQGTLKGGEITTPDRLVFTNWGKAADNPWDIPLVAGADFTRDGEDELDSALVMFWVPRTVKPGERFEIVVDYGLGGITFSSGQTYLGISAPAQVTYNPVDSRSYTIVMYLEHRGEAKAENVKINLSLPPGLEIVAGKANMTIPDLIPGVTKQFSWEVRPNGLFFGDTNFQIKVTGEHLEPNLVSRKMRIVGPPILTTTVELPTLKILANHWDPNPLVMSVKIKNTGETAANNLKAVFTGVSGVKLVDAERAEKFLGNLATQEETVVNWQIAPIDGSKVGQLKITIMGDGIKPVVVSKELEIPSLTSELSLAGPVQLQPGQVLNLSVKANNLLDASKFSLNVKYDPQQLRLVYLSRGTFLVEDNGLAQWDSGTIDNNAGTAVNIQGVRTKPFSGTEVTLLRLNFIVIGTGTGQVLLDNFMLFDHNDQEIPCRFIPIKYQIEEEKK